MAHFFNRLVGWFLLTFVASLVPIGVDWLIRKTGDVDTSVHALIGRGQLLLAAVALTFSVYGVLLMEAFNTAFD
jgi:hypothetical protein